MISDWLTGGCRRHREGGSDKVPFALPPPPAPPVATSDGIIVQCGNQESGVGRLCFTRNKECNTEIPVRPLMGLKFSVVCGIDNK